MAGALTISTLNDSSGVLATQNGMTGIAKAWVNFAGASGTVNGSFNVSSVTRASTGTYTVNLTTAMPNANYALVTGCIVGGSGRACYSDTAPTTTSFTVYCTNGASVVDPTQVWAVASGS